MPARRPSGVPDDNALSKATSQAFSKLVSHEPRWEKYDATKSMVTLFQRIKIGDTITTEKAILAGNQGMIVAYMEVIRGISASGKGGSSDDEMTFLWILSLIYNMLREDSSCYSLFEPMLRDGKFPFGQTLLDIIRTADHGAIAVNQAAWIYSAMVGNLPTYFKEQHVTDLVAALDDNMSDLGKLEALVNLLKSSHFRGLVWRQPGVRQFILHNATSTSTQELYKSVFAIWMLSCDAELVQELKDLKGTKIVKLIKDILINSRVEKVARICLTLLRNFLADKGLCEEIVEVGLLEVVQNLEFEKWRDSELYDEIREVSSAISTEMHEHSNFDRYMRELESGQLAWGFIHSSKFFGENVMKFGAGDFSAVKKLEVLLGSADETTQAIACHDIGEFVALHPEGKRQVAKYAIKDKVMALMGESDKAENREMRREALLCCQKIMLNKWQDIDGK